MFDWLKEIIREIWQYIVPVFIINEYERGVRLRFGKAIRKELMPGLHYKWPLIDNIHSAIVTTNTLSTHTVHITTTDNNTITVSPTIVFTITDTVRYLIDINEAESNLHDIVRSCTSDYLTDIDWAECKKKSTKTGIKRLLNKACEEMGVVVTEVMLTDLCICKVIITAI